MRSILLLAVALTGCVTATPQVFEMRLKNLVGKPIDRMIESRGAPDSVFPLSDGTKVYTFKDDSYSQAGKWWCDIKFVVAPDGIIKSAKADGNNCVSD